MECFVKSLNLKWQHEKRHAKVTTPTHGSPCQSHDNPRRCIIINTLSVKDCLADVAVQISSADDNFWKIIMHYFEGSLAEYLETHAKISLVNCEVGNHPLKILDLFNVLLQISHSTFTAVRLDQSWQSIFCDFDILILHSRRVTSHRYKIFLRMSKAVQQYI